MTRIKPIKPKKSLIEQALNTTQEITCPACQKKISVKLKDILDNVLKCPKCDSPIAINQK